MSDHIRIRRIGIFAYHGVLEEERRLGQRFFISLDLSLDLRAAGEADDIAKSVSYADLCDRVQEIAVGNRFLTLEGLGEAIAREVLREFPLVAEITVEIEKPGAPIAALLENVSVLITRSRHG